MLTFGLYIMVQVSHLMQCLGGGNSILQTFGETPIEYPVKERSDNFHSSFNKRRNSLQWVS